jgi:predicted CXXCH cytochrome family protein
VRCHGKQVQQAESAHSAHAPFVQGQCTACHDPHQAALPKLRLATGPDACLSCHTVLKEQMAAGVTHKPAGEDCLGCHTPHASAFDKLTTAAPVQLCARCHDLGADKFKKAHLGADVSRCTTCHDPHAGKDARLLNRVTHQPFDQGKCSACHASGGRP